MEKYRYGSHTVYQIEYHFVWVTKYRYKVLMGEIGVRARGLVRQTCEAFEIRIIKGVISKDHLHILVSCPGDGAVGDNEANQSKNSKSTVGRVSAFKEAVLGRHFWARGYFCATVGQMTQEMIRQYLEHHFEPNQNDQFQMEPD